MTKKEREGFANLERRIESFKKIINRQTADKLLTVDAEKEHHGSILNQTLQALYREKFSAFDGEVRLGRPYSYGGVVVIPVVVDKFGIVDLLRFWNYGDCQRIISKSRDEHNHKARKLRRLAKKKSL